MICNQDNCGACCGGSCSGCGGALALTEAELAFLVRFADIPFLPVARDFDGETPVFFDDGTRVDGDTITWLRLKGFISVDYDVPLINFDYAEYEKYPVRGSMALTASGQAALDTLEIMGVEE